MMGHAHAMSGALAWSAFALAAPHLGLHLDAPQMLAGSLATSGAALLPDADHPSGTIAWTFGRPSRWACRKVNALAGGHRRCTHTLLFPLGAALGLWLVLLFASLRADQQWVALPILFALTAFGLKATHITVDGRPHARVSHWTWIVSTLFTVAIGIAGVDLVWLPLAVGIGALAHLLGDCLTVEGCPLFWPLKPMHSHVRLPVLGHAGSTTEKALVPVMGVGAAVLPMMHWWGW